jgi:hypothetical protein
MLTYGDVWWQVSKLGDRVLPEVIPILQDGLHSESELERAGMLYAMYADVC